jgi:hypothetical protein
VSFAQVRSNTRDYGLSASGGRLGPPHPGSVVFQPVPKEKKRLHVSLFAVKKVQIE